MDVRGSGPIRIGVSACLLGQEVRFDGGHKRNDFLTGTLGDFVEFVAVCPEVDIGLGIPRESLRLVRDDSGAVRMIANKSGADVTDAMSAYAERRAAALERDDLSGYVLKKDSPSCGMERVRICGRAGMPVRDNRAAGGAADADSPLGAALRYRLSQGPDLSRTASARADAAQPRVRAAGQRLSGARCGSGFDFPGEVHHPRNPLPSVFAAGYRRVLGRIIGAAAVGQTFHHRIVVGVEEKRN